MAYEYPFELGDEHFWSPKEEAKTEELRKLLAAEEASWPGGPAARKLSRRLRMRKQFKEKKRHMKKKEITRAAAEVEALQELDADRASGKPRSKWLNTIVEPRLNSFDAIVAAQKAEGLDGFNAAWCERVAAKRVEAAEVLRRDAEQHVYNEVKHDMGRSWFSPLVFNLDVKLELQSKQYMEDAAELRKHAAGRQPPSPRLPTKRRPIHFD